MRSNILMQWLIVPLVAVVPQAVSARADDVIMGEVRSVDPEAETIDVIDSRTGQVIHVVIGNRSAITLADGAALELPRLKPGAFVRIRDSAASMGHASDGLPGEARSNDGKPTMPEGDGNGKAVLITLGEGARITSPEGAVAGVEALAPGTRAIADTPACPSAGQVALGSRAPTILGELWHNFRHNLFKPLLLFFYMGFLVPILGVKFEFPHAMYQALTIYLLVAIGWHGGKELSALDPSELGGALGFMVVGFLTNTFIGFIAYLFLSAMTTMRRIDKATVAGYYGSDSAGTFVTCLGVLAAAGIAYEPYMPVMLALMEIPGCLVALILVGWLRQQGMDALGNMPDEPGYSPANAAGAVGTAGHGDPELAAGSEVGFAPGSAEDSEDGARKSGRLFSPQLVHEVLLNPGLYLLFGGIAVGFISGCQGPEVTKADDSLFVTLFHGMLCLFLLEMGMTASRKLRDLRTAGTGFVLYGLLAPNVFATIGILVAHGYGLATGTPLALGTYALFAVLCGASSYIAVPAVQRLAIPEASPTLPLAASLGLTFSYNVTIGIPVYIEIAKLIIRTVPVG